MAKGKYSKDYRLVEEFRENGRVHTGFEYIGEPWFFCADEKTVAEEKKKALGLIILAAAAFVMALIPYSGMMHRLWIALPFGFSAIPLFLTGDLVFSMQKWTGPMENRNADKLNNSYPPRTLAVAYLSIVALIAEIVYLVRNGFAVPGDRIVLICTAVMFWCALMLFKRRGHFKAEANHVRNTDG